MTLGAIMMYLGVALLFNSPGVARLVLLSAAGLTEKQTARLHAKAG